MYASGMKERRLAGAVYASEMNSEGRMCMWTYATDFVAIGFSVRGAAVSGFLLRSQRSMGAAMESVL
jgi:hypothetical protein